MKKKLICLFAALALLAGLAVPAGAMETSTRPGESWRMEKETFYGQLAKEYAATHPEEYGAFDDEAYEAMLAKSGYSEEELTTHFRMDKETLRKMLWLVALEDEELEKRAQKEYQAYITQAYEALSPGEIDQVGLPWAMGIFGYESPAEFAEQTGINEEEARNYLASCYVNTRQVTAYNHEKSLEYREQYPGSWENYDPYAQYTPSWEYVIRNTMDRYGLQTDEEFKEYMYVNSYMPDSYIWEQEQAAKRAEYPQRWPEEYARFDPDAWFAGYYGILTPESYMEREGLDEEGFKRIMFLEWADKSRNFFNGYCVTVDGTPIQFQFYRDLDGEVVGPKVENERILIPFRAAAEALDLTVEWRPETNQVVCSDESTAVTFTLDSTEYSGGTLDAAPFAEKGVTYLPLRALGEALGCGVTWYPEFATAALTTR